MKQKIVIKVELCCNKCRSTAMKIAAAADGVSSVALEGDDKDKVVVVGDCVDAAELTCSLRKKFNCAKLLTVEEVKPKKDDGQKPKEKEKDGKCQKEPKPTPPACCSKPCCPPEPKPTPPACCSKPCCPPEPKPTPPACCSRPCCPPPHCELYKVVYDPNPCSLM